MDAGIDAQIDSAMGQYGVESSDVKSGDACRDRKSVHGRKMPPLA